MDAYCCQEASCDMEPCSSETRTAHSILKRPWGWSPVIGQSGAMVEHQTSIGISAALAELLAAGTIG